MHLEALQAVVFDLDGTLADTAGDIREALATVLRGEGLPAPDLAGVRRMVGGGPAVLIERALRALDVAPDDAFEARLTQAFLDVYLRMPCTHSRLYTGAADTLRALRARGLHVGLCSNKPDAACRALLQDLAIADCFDAVLGSGPDLPRKPDPTPLLWVLDTLGVSPDAAMYVGDSETDVRTARAAGVGVALVTYGYTTQPAEALGADHVISALADILD